MHRTHHLYQAIIALSVFVLSCGQLGIADFDLGPDPSTAVGPYKRVAIVRALTGSSLRGPVQRPAPTNHFSF